MAKHAPPLLRGLGTGEWLKLALGALILLGLASLGLVLFASLAFLALALYALNRLGKYLGAATRQPATPPPVKELAKMIEGDYTVIRSDRFR